MEEIQGTSAELFKVAIGNKEAMIFLLGYVASEIPPPIIREALAAWHQHRAELRAFEYVFEQTAGEIYDPRD